MSRTLELYLRSTTRAHIDGFQKPFVLPAEIEDCLTRLGSSRYEYGVNSRTRTASSDAYRVEAYIKEAVTQAIKDTLAVGGDAFDELLEHFAAKCDPRLPEGYEHMKVTPGSKP